MPGIESLFAGSAPQAQPVQNVPALTNDLINQQVMNQARQAQTAGAAQDMQLKQRGMQLSMLAGLDNILDPAKRAEAQPHVIAMANKLNPSYQIDPSIDEGTRRALIMSGVPVEQQPGYGLAQSNTAINQALLGALGGAPAAAGGANPDGGMPSSAANAPAAGIGSAPAISAPQGSMSPQAQELLAIARPEASKALQGTPLYKQQATQAETVGKNTAEAQKHALESNEGYQQVEQTIDSLKRLIDDPDLPQSSYGIPAKAQAWTSQNFGDQKTANAYNTFSTINESETINAIRDLANTGQIRMTRTLENIINKGYLIDPDASKTAKLQQANAIKTELKNSAIAAQNVSTKMSGSGSTGEYSAPYPAQSSAASQLPAQMQPQPGNAATQAQGALKPPVPQTGTAIDTPEAIKAAFNAGKLTKEQAISLLKAKHGFE